MKYLNTTIQVLLHQIKVNQCKLINKIQWTYRDTKSNEIKSYFEQLPYISKITLFPSATKSRFIPYTD